MEQKHGPHIIRLRTIDELAAGFGTQDENRDFRLAVIRAAQTHRGTVVLSQDGDPLAVILAAATNRARELIETGPDPDRGMTPDPSMLDWPDIVTRLAALFGVLTGADTDLRQDTEEFLSGEGASQDDLNLPERIERWLRYGR